MRKCKVCGIPYTAKLPMQVVCGPACAHKKVKQDKAEEVKETKRRKAALKTLPELKKEAQQAFNAYIRERDKGKPCISCGRPDDKNGYHQGRDCGHYRSVGSAAHLRYAETNAHGQCVFCNRNLAGNVIGYRLGLIERIGIEAVEKLEQDNSTRKWTRDELIDIKREYVEKLKKLKHEL